MLVVSYCRIGGGFPCQLFLWYLDACCVAQVCLGGPSRTIEASNCLVPHLGARVTTAHMDPVRTYPAWLCDAFEVSLNM